MFEILLYCDIHMRSLDKHKRKSYALIVVLLCVKLARDPLTKDTIIIRRAITSIGSDFRHSIRHVTQ